MNECASDKIKQILAANGVDIQATKRGPKHRGRPRKAELEDVPPEPLNEPPANPPTVEEEPPVAVEEDTRTVVPEEVITAAQEKMHNLEARVWEISDELKVLLNEQRALSMWLKGVKTE